MRVACVRVGHAHLRPALLVHLHVDWRQAGVYCSEGESRSIPQVLGRAAKMDMRTLVCTVTVDADNKQ